MIANIKNFRPKISVFNTLYYFIHNCYLFFLNYLSIFSKKKAKRVELIFYICMSSDYHYLNLIYNHSKFKLKHDKILKIGRSKLNDIIITGKYI